LRPALVEEAQLALDCCEHLGQADHSYKPASLVDDIGAPCPRICEDPVNDLVEPHCLRDDYWIGHKVLADERKKLLSEGYLTGFQRVDRMTASASLDGRMPIMSQRIVEYGLSLGRRALLGSKPERNKLVLRKAFEGLLPEEVVWRRKQRFSDGAGSMNSLVKVAEKLISDRGFEKERAALPGGRIRTKEELLYFRTFSKFFPVKSAVNAVGITLRP